MKAFKLILCLGAVVGLATATFAQGFNRRPGGLLNRAGGRQVQQPNRGAANAANAPTAVEAGGRSIEFNQAPVEMVFKVYGDLVGKTVIKDPAAPQANITLQPKQGQELSDEDKILAIETVLEMNGIHLEPYGEKFVRALPRKGSRKEGIPLIMDPDAELGESSRVVSIMLTFQNIALEEAQKALEGLKSDKADMNVFERSNSILVTDTEMNINRMREVIRKIDIPTPVTENVFVRQVVNASAQDIKTALEAIVQESQKELEKQGKAANQVRPQATPTVNRLLGRNQQQQQPAATPNATFVTSVSDADRGMIRGKVLILADERSNKLIIVTSKSNMDFFDKVIEQLDVETTPDTVVKVYRLKYAEAEDVSDMINDLIGNAPSGKNSTKGNQNASAKQTGGGGRNMTTGGQGARKSANQRSGEAKAGELSKDNTTVLADKRINGLVVMTSKELVPVVEQIIESMDIKLAQVLIETVIIEVTLGDDLKTGVDWVRLGDKQNVYSTIQGANGRDVYNYVDSAGNVTRHEDVGTSYTSQTTDEESGELVETTWTRIGDALQQVTGDERSGFWNGVGNSALTSMMGGGGGTGSSALEALVGVSTNVATLTPIGSGLNYFFKSDALNLGAVIQATKTDNRAKYIASPIVMTVDNKEATIEATQARKFLSGYQSNSSSSYYGSSIVPQYEGKDIGIKIKVTPKINPNGTVMLTIEEEYSQLGAKQTIQDPNSKSVAIDTSLTRKMSADALLENAQTVILGGLTETYTSESETGIPILKDIPWIGKWLFGSVSQAEDRKELLVFMTPYVLNDADEAQLEALRRKKALSDTRPWDDHGWSASKLADPVAKKEQIRRLKDEAKRQDEERKTKLAIEKWKIERAEQLKKLTTEERDIWLEMQKDEYKKEKKEGEIEELEKKMGEKGHNDELRELAEKLRARKLAEAEKELKANEDLIRADNERAKMDAAKKKAQEETSDDQSKNETETKKGTEE